MPFFRFSLPSSRLTHLTVCVLAAPLLAISALAQDKPCPEVNHGDPTAAEAAYASGRYEQAENQYGQALAKDPHNLELSSGLVKTWLHEGEIDQAAAQVNKILPDSPNSAITLTSLAEVQFAQGQPWAALESLKTAEAADPCYARIYLVRGRVLRIDSMYASQRAQIQKAYDIDPKDPDIRHAFLSTVSPAHEIEGTTESLATMKDLDPETRKLAENSVRSLMPLLFENNQTCHILPTTASASFKLQPSMQDAKHIDGYRLEVDLPKTKANLQVDTAASGLFISKDLADANGFEPAAGDPPGTVRVDTVRIGPLEFHDCVVGVSETPFAGKSDGFIGTDMFASYLVTLDYPVARLALDPLPKQTGVVPGDRVVPAELQGYTPVYRRQQYLLLPVTLNDKVRRLFILDSGIRYSTMTSDVAHSVSTTKVNFTNTVPTVSGGSLKVYRDTFNFQLASLPLGHQGHVLELDASNIDRNTGIQIAGMIGYDVLHSFVLNLDYRDGLVKMESAEAIPGHAKGTMTASDSESSCNPQDAQDVPKNAVLEAKVIELIDSAHLKPGKEVLAKVVNPWEFPECNLSAGAILYGHVVTSNNVPPPNASELSLVFDHGECDGAAKKPLSLTIVSMLGPPDQFVGLHSALPTEVSGGGRTVGNMTDGLSYMSDEINLNPGGAPKTIHPGIVLGISGAKLEPTGGPACSSKITDTEHSVRIGIGSELLFNMHSTKQQSATP